MQEMDLSPLKFHGNFAESVSVIQRLFIFSFSFLAVLGSGCQKGLFGSSEDSVIAQSSQEDCGYIQNSAGARVSWKSIRPVSIKINSEVPSEFHDAILKAADRWNSAIGSKVLDVQVGTESEPGRIASQNSSNGIFWYQDWDESMTTQQAVTTVYYRGNQANESDIKINAKNFVFYVSDPKSNHDVHMESLMVHEFGHVLGLKHLSIWPTVMWPTLAGQIERTTLAAKDLEDLKCEY